VKRRNGGTRVLRNRGKGTGTVAVRLVIGLDHTVDVFQMFGAVT
jgi:hypothetical protein